MVNVSCISASTAVRATRARSPSGSSTYRPRRYTIRRGTHQLNSMATVEVRTLKLSDLISRRTAATASSRRRNCSIKRCPRPRTEWKTQCQCSAKRWTWWEADVDGGYDHTISVWDIVLLLPVNRLRRGVVGDFPGRAVAPTHARRTVPWVDRHCGYCHGLRGKGFPNLRRLERLVAKYQPVVAEVLHIEMEVVSSKILPIQADQVVELVQQFQSIGAEDAIFRETDQLTLRL